MSTGVRTIFRAFRYRNYRLFFGGQMISMIGTWMQRLAMSWLVYRITGSAWLLGVVGFSTQMPTFLLAPVAGVLADRWDRRRMLVITQTLAMLQAFALAALILCHVIAVWHIICLGIFLGIVNAFDMPSRQAFLVEMVEQKEDLGNAIAFNSSIVNGARLIGPSVAGMLVATVGEGICFFLNGVSYVAVILALLAMRVTPKAEGKPHAAMVDGLKEGFWYAVKSKPIRSVILLLSLVSLMGMPYAVLMPVFAKEILHGNSYLLGFLTSMAGVGALLGAVFLASRKSVIGLLEIIPVASGVFGGGLIVFSLSRVVPLSLALMGVVGFGMMVQMASSNTILQTIVEDDKRGRVMSFYTMSFFGMAPLGSLLAGASARIIGAPNTVILGGVSCIVGALLFARVLPALLREVRPLYSKMGITSRETLNVG